MPFVAKGLQYIDRKTIQKHVIPAGIALGIGLCLTLPSYLSVRATSEQLKQTRDSITAAYRNVKLLPALEEEKNRLAKQINDTRQSLFTEQEVANFVADISELARDLSVQITSSRPNRLEEYIDPAFRHAYEAFEFEIDMECEFHGLVKLLATLYQKPKIFKIQELTISGRESKIELNKVSLSLAVISAKNTAGGSNAN
ncbi:MAG: type 4a pilus biogenesis protein PilO [Candidatus Omnitrophica bacterium]|nr:type 4a pilus biogenesis protein PilO [Candidatus Omnitrophota bacterium]